MAQTSRRLRYGIPTHVTVIAAIVIVCALLVGLDASRTWQARSLQIAEDKAETANLAMSLAQHAHDMMEAADTVLVGLRHNVETGGLEPDKLASLHDYMNVSIATLPAVHGLFVYDAKGRWIVNSNNDPSKALNNSDRAYFQYHRSNPDRAVHFGLSVRSKSDGAWVITLSRRLNAPDGSFAGLVLATVSIDAIQDFYGRFDVGEHGAIALASRDGFLIARHPADDSLIGVDVSNGELFKAIVQRSSPAGSLEYVSAVDGVTRLGSYRQVEDFPLRILVSHGLDDVLADWRADTWYHSTVVLCVVAVLVLFGQWFARQIRRRQHAEERYQLLAEYSSDAIFCVSLSGERLYVSPAFEEMTGWSEKDGVGKDWGCYIHPDDREPLLDIGRQLINGSGHAIRVYRFVCKDGAHLWVEARFVLLPATRRDPTQFVASIRDITARKVAEDYMEAAKQELAKQVSCDGLTGLANRRRFDEALDQEWRRAAREARPLSLLIIDVDCFKSYNDRFGHQNGDGCLRAVAAALAQAVQRPGDLVARYGGEEFAVVLADTDASGASEVAERIRAAVEGLGIKHPASPSAGCVTVSVGVGTGYPNRHDRAVKQDALIEAADTALHGAKGAGRNCVFAAAPLSVFPKSYRPLAELSSHESDRRPSQERKNSAVRTLPVPGQAAAAVETGDRVFHNPALRQNHEADLAQAVEEPRHHVATISVKPEQERVEHEKQGHQQHAAVTVPHVG